MERKTQQDLINELQATEGFGGLVSRGRRHQGNFVKFLYTLGYIVNDELREENVSITQNMLTGGAVWDAPKPRILRKAELEAKALQEENNVEEEVPYIDIEEEVE